MGASLNTVWWSGVIATEEEEYIEDNQIEYPGDPTGGSPENIQNGRLSTTVFFESIYTGA